jgi:hypothetical protein
MCTWKAEEKKVEEKKAEEKKAAVQAQEEAPAEKPVSKVLLFMIYVPMLHVLNAYNMAVYITEVLIFGLFPLKN